MTAHRSASPPTIQDVREYWDNHPLFSHEIDALGSREYFEKLNDIKLQDVERFAMDFWEFGRFAGKRVLDVGCGPGWITVQYAANGATVDSVDLTPNAVELTKAHLALRGLSAHVQTGNAEQLPFPNDVFDLVVSSGVLHHTPDTRRAFSECFRVLKPRGTAKITLYRKGLLHRPSVFWLVRMLMRALGMKHPGADMSRNSNDVDDFIRQYDGAENPIGIGHDDDTWRRLLTATGFQYVSRETHFFPARFIKWNQLVPPTIHRLLDRYFGTMVYFNLRK